MRIQFWSSAARAALLVGALGATQANAQSAPSDFTTAHRYDQLRREVGTIAPDPDGAGPVRFQASRTTFDPAGRLVRIEKGELTTWQPETVAPSAWSGFTVSSQVDMEYDPTGRRIRESISSGGLVSRVTQYSYDSAGRLACTAVRMNPAVFASLPVDACAQSAAGIDGPDRITKNVYDALGQLAQLRKGVGTSFEQAYVTYTYTADGKQEYVVDAGGAKARLLYDGLDRQVQWQFPSATKPAGFTDLTPASALATAGSVNTADFEAYGYDANGNRISLRKRDGRNLIFGYDPANRMVSKIVPDCPSAGPCCVSSYTCAPLSSDQTRDVYYSYDLTGLPIAARFDSQTGGDAVVRSYDGFGRLASSTTSMGGFTAALTYQYDANGNQTRVTYPDGNYAGYHYDGIDRLDTAGINSDTGLLTRSYDAAGQLAQNLSGSWTYYTHDGAGRLASQTEALSGGAGSIGTTFVYNAAGQIVSKSRSNDAYAFTAYQNVDRGYSVNGLNQYGSAGDVSFNYDSNGNLTASGSTSYAYDTENRLVTASTGVSLVYDPLGRLFQISGGSSGLTRFLYSGDELMAEYDGSANLLRRYIHGPGGDDPLAWLEGASVGGAWANARIAKPDYQGTIVLWTDWNGSLANINRFDEYGIPAATNIGRFQYTGQAWLAELGMYYYKARIYSPTLGRFLQTDPIGYEGQLNLYGYVGNDPTNNTDPTGEDCVDPDKSKCEESTITVTAKKAWNGFVAIMNTQLVPRVHIDLPKPVVAIAGALGFSEKCVESTSVADCTTGEKLTALSFLVTAGPSLATRALGQLGNFTVTAKHLLGAGGRWAQFTTADTAVVKGLIAQTLKSPGKIVYDSARGNYQIFSKSLGAIGTAGENYIRVIVNSAGRIISAHPIKAVP